MKYFIYSFLIFSFLMISILETTAQKSCILFGDKYGLIINDKNSDENIDTLLYDTQMQTFNKLNGEKSILESNRGVKSFGAFAAANQLKEDGLVVVLKSSKGQLEKLRILSRSRELSEGQRQNIKKRITAIEKENKIINTALISSFSNSYRFSDVYFTYDSSLISLKSGVQQGIFADKNGLLDSSIKINEPNFYICNYTLVSASNESEGLVIYNAKMDKVKSPFPNVAVSGASGLNMLLQLLTNNDTYYDRKIQKDVLKLEKNLRKVIERGNEQFKKL